VFSLFLRDEPKREKMSFTNQEKPVKLKKESTSESCAARESVEELRLGKK